MQVLQQYKDIVLFTFGGLTVYVGYIHKRETTTTFASTSMTKCKNRFKKYVACAYSESK